MKPAVLVLGIVVASAAIVVWALSTIRVPARAPAASVSTPPESPAPKPAPRSTPRPAAETQAAAPAPVPPAPAPLPAVEIKPPMPFPTLEQIAVGETREGLLTAFHEPTIRTTTNLGGDLLETFIYSTGAPKDTWVVLRNGTVAAKFAADHTGVRR